MEDGKYDWRKDPEVLERLDTISRLQIVGNTQSEMSFKMGLSRRKLEADLQKLNILRAEEYEKADLLALRAHSVELFRAVEREAWRRLETVALDSRTGADLLNQITAAEREVMRLQGTPATEKRESGYDPQINIQVVNGIVEKLNKGNDGGRTKELPQHLDAAGIIDGEILLAPVGESEPDSP